MNRADRQRIIHGLQRDMAALERVTEIVRELIEDQLDQLASLRPSQQLAGSGGGNEPPVLKCVSCNVYADDDGRCPNCDEVVLARCCDCYEVGRHLSWCPWNDEVEPRIKAVQPQDVPLSKPQADLEERGTSQPGRKTGTPEKGRSASHRKVVRHDH